MKITTLIIMFVLAFSSFAEVKEYKETDNEGMTKPERFTSIEKHMIDLSKAINSLESKFDENAKKVKVLEDVVAMIKLQENKKSTEKLGEKNSDTEDEMKKLKEDFLTIKNKDIEKIKQDLYDLNLAIKEIKSQSK